MKETGGEAVVSFGKGIRKFVIDVGSGNMVETLYSDKYNITLSSLVQDEKVYVSALHFLGYLGATVKLDENFPIQFMVIKRYDIFDGLSDLMDSDSGNFFWWDEVDTGDENLLSWNCILPQGSFPFEEIKYIGASVHTSRSRQHVTTYESDGDKLRHIDTLMKKYIVKAAK